MLMAKGKKTGGRERGSLNRRTLEKLAEVAREAQDVRTGGKKFAKEVLDELMATAMSFAAREQRRILDEEEATDPDGTPRGVASQETYDRFWIAMNAAGTFAKALAPFQHPTFRAIAVVPPAAEPPAPKTIEGSVVNLNDPIAVARIYQQMVRAVR
jgi:hypothetical protein